jgi:5-methylthioribose kinase
VQITLANAVAYARQRRLISHGENPRLEPLTGGVACTVMRLHTARGPIVIKQAQPKFRVAAEWLVDPARNILEAQFQKLAREALGAAHVPDVLDIDEPNFAYTMASAPLDAQNWKTMLLAGDVRPLLGQQCARLLARLHRIPLDEPHLPAGVRDPKFFLQQRLEPYFEFTAARHRDVTAFAGLIEELKKPRCVTHGDYTPKNFLVAGDNLILLDYEVVHLGAGEFDVASIVNHLTLKMFRLPAHRAALRATLTAFLDELARQGVMLPAWWLPLLGALLLARVDGKSPAEYLREVDKPRIREAAKRLLRGEFAAYEEFEARTF